jgi:hypothetical protein
MPHSLPAPFNGKMETETWYNTWFHISNLHQAACSYKWQTSGESLSGITGLTPVPEPSAAVLLFTAVLLLSALGKFVRVSARHLLSEIQ